MKRVYRLAMLLAAPVVINLVLVAPSLAARSGGLYTLDEGSSYQEGCFDPCMCPILANATLIGTFLLSSADRDGEASVFEVEHVDWHFQMLGRDVAVAGDGTYTLWPKQQRLELDLKVGDAPVRHFDSGLVPLLAARPTISIDVSVNAFFCYDYAFSLVAHLVPVGVRGETWGAVKGTYRR